MRCVWSVLTVVAVIAHYVFLAYLITGGFLAWRRPWSIGTHVLTVIWAMLIVITKVPCPLTALQNTAREHLGQRPLSGGFIHIYARGVLYPIGWDRIAQIVVGVVVLSSWIGLAVRWRTARRAEIANRERGARVAQPLSP